MLAAAGDPERAVGSQRYMKSAMPYHGVPMSRVRSLVARVVAAPEHRLTTRSDWEATVRSLWDNAIHREERYAAQVLAGHRRYRPWQDVDTLDLYRDLIVDAAWWDHVDDLATHHVSDILRAHRTDATPVLRRWLVDEDLWPRRAAIISQLSHKEDTDLALLTDAIEANLETDADGDPTAYGSELFIRKAIGWALRQHARTDPQWVLDFVAAHRDRLSGLSRREALKHL